MDKPKEETKPDAQKVVRSTRELNYTEKYEYAASLIKLYLDREALISDMASPGIPKLFQEDGPLYVLFTANYKFLANPGVASDVCKYLEVDPFKDPPAEKAPIIRLYGVFFDIAAACGIDFIKELVENVRKMVVLTSGVSNDKLEEFVKEMDVLFGRIPIVALLIIGAKDYYSRYLESREKIRTAALNSQKQNRAQKVAAQALSQT